MVRIGLVAMLALAGCAETSVEDFVAGMVENAGRSACRSADNCESLCANGAVSEHSDAICVVRR